MNRNIHTGILVVVVLILASFGLIMVYSSSYILAEQRFGDAYYFVKKQLLFCGFGITLMFACIHIPKNFWIKYLCEYYGSS